MVTQFAILAVSAIVTVAAVRLLVIYGIEVVCVRLHWSLKTKGQIIGYATSLPELVMVIASATVAAYAKDFSVFDAGLWNVASSNIINWVLFLLALAAYRQFRELLSPMFVDEIAFGLVSVALPLVLIGCDVQMGLITAAILLGVFILYKWLDHLLNRRRDTTQETDSVSGSLGLGLAALVGGIALILVAGRFLGVSAGDLVTRFHTPAWLVGWIVGVITSLPEMTSFFEIYRLSKKRGQLHRSDDTQNVLDALVASNMCNLGIILPVGIFVYYFLAAG
jgi:Ca2+/Na+ antiporter